MKKYYIYILRCADDSLYTGYTVDLVARELTHNTGKGAAYTRGRLPVKIVYHEVFATKSEAMKREFSIKQLKRSQKEDLLNTKCPKVEPSFDT